MQNVKSNSMPHFVYQVTAAPPPVTKKLLNPPKRGLLELAVGESYTFGITVTSNKPFVVAIALTNEYFAGLGAISLRRGRAIRRRLARSQGRTG